MPRACARARRHRPLRGAPILALAAVACGTSPAPVAAPPPAAQAPPGQAPDPVDDFLIVPGRSVGRIDGTTAPEQLAALLPGQILHQGTCGDPEGDEILCTQVASSPGAPALIVYWTAAGGDAGRPAGAPRTVDVLSDRFHTAEGVRVGLTLTELVARNGGAEIRFYGFGWDFGGTISSLSSGPLDRPGLEIRLAYAAGTDPALVAPLAGESEFKSSDPRVARVPIAIDRLRVRVAPSP